MIKKKSFKNLQAIRKEACFETLFLLVHCTLTVRLKSTILNLQSQGGIMNISQHNSLFRVQTHPMVPGLCGSFKYGFFCVGLT